MMKVKKQMKCILLGIVLLLPTATILMSSNFTNSYQLLAFAKKKVDSLPSSSGSPSDVKKNPNSSNNNNNNPITNTGDVSKQKKVKEICDNGIDDDGDGKIDSEDKSDCSVLSPIGKKPSPSDVPAPIPSQPAKGPISTTPLPVQQGVCIPIIISLAVTMSVVPGGNTDYGSAGIKNCGSNSNSTANPPSILYLYSSDTGVATVSPASQNVASSLWAHEMLSFQVKTFPVASTKQIFIFAKLSTAQGERTRQVSLTVSPATLAYLLLKPMSVVGGADIDATVGLQGLAATPNGATVSLYTSKPAVVNIPQSVKVPSGYGRVSFPIHTSKVLKDTPITITAKLGTDVRTESLSVLVLRVTSLTFTSNPVAGGANNDVTGKVTLNRVASAGDPIILRMSSSNPAAAVPNTVTVQLAATVNFVIHTSAVTENTPVDITAQTQNNPSSTQTATLTLVPLALSVFKLSPNPVLVGDNVLVHLKLNGKAPPGDTTFSISSPGHSGIDLQKIIPGFPEQVSIAAGTDHVDKRTGPTQAAFKSLSFKASYGGITKQVTLVIAGIPIPLPSSGGGPFS